MTNRFTQLCRMPASDSNLVRAGLYRLARTNQSHVKYTVSVHMHCTAALCSHTLVSHCAAAAVLYLHIRVGGSTDRRNATLRRPQQQLHISRAC